ncbi:MAG: hypothetical protein VW496_02280 [Pelagibacteraceae bacterium]
MFDMYIKTLDQVWDNLYDLELARLLDAGEAYEVALVNAATFADDYFEAEWYNLNADADDYYKDMELER